MSAIAGSSSASSATAGSSSAAGGSNDAFVADVRRLHGEANAALRGSVSRLDALLRPVQRAYFACCTACTDDSRATEAVSSCVAACAEPLSAVQGKLRAAQDDFQARVRGCHGAAGELVKGDAANPTAAEAAAYTRALRPCLAAATDALPALVEPVYAAVAPAMAQIKATTPKSAGWLW